MASQDTKIIMRQQFIQGVSPWYGHECTLEVTDDFYCLATKRKSTSSGLMANISKLIELNKTYTFTARVQVSKEGFPTVQATIWDASRGIYFFIAKTTGAKDSWVEVSGQFCAAVKSDNYRLYIHGPPADVDLRVLTIEIREEEIPKELGNLVANPDFSLGLKSWIPNGVAYPIIPEKMVIVTNRTNVSHGLEQDITGRIFPGHTYQLVAQLGVAASSEEPYNVEAKIVIQDQNYSSRYVNVASTQARNSSWSTIEGGFQVGSQVLGRVILQLFGPPAGVALLIKSVEIKQVD